MFHNARCDDWTFFSPGACGCSAEVFHEQLGKDDASSLGQCRKNPPREGITLGCDHDIPAKWPRVHAENWCGQFQPRVQCPNGITKNHLCGRVSTCTESCPKRHTFDSMCKDQIAEKNGSEKSCACKVGRNDPNACKKTESRVFCNGSFLRIKEVTARERITRKDRVCFTCPVIFRMQNSAPVCPCWAMAAGCSNPATRTGSPLRAQPGRP